MEDGLFFEDCSGKYTEVRVISILQTSTWMKSAISKSKRAS